MQRYYILDNQIINNQIHIKGSDVHHIKNVMRMKKGDEITSFSDNGCYLCQIDEIKDEEVVVLINEKLAHTELNVKVSIAQAAIKKERFELFLEKATELGAYEIIPTFMDRSVIKETVDQHKKIERFQKIVKEASEQSKRTYLPKVKEYTYLKDIDYSKYDKVFVAYEKLTEDNNLKKELNVKYSNILLIIGPEGGFSDKEIDYLSKLKNVSFIGLGKRILRSETASMYFMAVISYVYEL